MLDATTERNCAILLRCMLDAARFATAFENMTDAQLYGCPCELIFHEPILTQCTYAGPEPLPTALTVGTKFHCYLTLAAPT